MRLYRTVEPKYSIKSRKARKVFHIMDRSFIRKNALSFLVFGPREKSKGFCSHRLPVKKLIEELKQTAAFPEDITITPASDPYLEVLAKNVATKELYLMRKYDYTIILLINVGSISEFSAYVTKPDVAHKIRLYVQEGHRKSGYLMAGPVKIFKDAHRQVYYFDNPRRLLGKIRKKVFYLLALKFFQT